MFYHRLCNSAKIFCIFFRGDVTEWNLLLAWFDATWLHHFSCIHRAPFLLNDFLHFTHGNCGSCLLLAVDCVTLTNLLRCIIFLTKLYLNNVVCFDMMASRTTTFNSVKSKQTQLHSTSNKHSKVRKSRSWKTKAGLHYIEKIMIFFSFL